MSQADKPRSSAYETFPAPILSSRNGFDFHVYFMPTNPVHVQHALQLHQRISSEFPELPIYRVWDRPIGTPSRICSTYTDQNYSGPHPTAMFEVQTKTPHQMGALFGWLVVNRGPLDILVHPNTDDAYRDHAELASWIGKPWPLNLEVLKGHRTK
ncbi:DOPA-like domain-containing protein [Pisolithus thermaeus]|nr:DOPA-like domain-containing protein [Pisolithus sp. B1]KAI6126410.1 DOPA-like domain-containing protein [Pisolithus croceorrhizus]KAI6164618.1 DOPA-like domain-containing protein [Pisolithus thermaeus]